MKISTRISTLVLVLTLLISCLSITASAAEGTMYGIGFVKADSLRLRSEASTSSKTLADAPNGDCVVVISKSGDWYKVNYNLTEGYMHADYLTVSTKENAELGYGQITGSGVNMRSGPSTAHSVVATGTLGEKCYIIGMNEGWYKVIYHDKICYIRSDFVKLTEYPYENQASPNVPKFYRGGKSVGAAPSVSALAGNASSGSAVPSVPAVPVTGSDILAEAQKYLGTPYAYGGATPSGFDCSGYVYYVLKQVGLSPYRTPASQFNQGTAVSKEMLQPGDIVFFAGTAASGISHVGIYAGNGQFIHAPNSRSTVSYSDLSSGYWGNHYYGARRMS